MFFPKFFQLLSISMLTISSGNHKTRYFLSKANDLVILTDEGYHIVSVKCLQTHPVRKKIMNSSDWKRVVG